MKEWLHWSIEVWKNGRWSIEAWKNSCVTVLLGGFRLPAGEGAESARAPALTMLARHYLFSALSIERIHLLYHPLAIGYQYLLLQYDSNTAIDAIDSRLIQKYTSLFILVFYIQEAYYIDLFYLILAYSSHQTNRTTSD